jgi:DUF2911 family protein
MRTSSLLVAAAIVVTFTPASAQRASQHGIVSQTVDETEIRLEYDRPVARGRELFGELVEWDTHHGMFPFESEVLRIEVASERGAHMETLAYYFPVVGPYEATLRMHWGPTIVPLRIGVRQ